MKIVLFIPIKLNNQRLSGKNTMPLNGKPLCNYIFDTVKDISCIDEKYVYCSNEEIISYIPDGIKFLKRNSCLDKDETLGEEIYDAFIKQVDADLYILVHTTSPFLKADTLRNAILQISDNCFDSALSVEKSQTFAWYDNQPLNYLLDKIPRTQDIQPVFVETSAFYMFKKEVWINLHQRVGIKPYFAVTDKIESVDIDDATDFAFASVVADYLAKKK
jgi:CMP-N-acetylneuraminic acid synthetase